MQFENFKIIESPLYFSGIELRFRHLRKLRNIFKGERYKTR